MAHHTKDKGDLGVFKAQLDMYMKGYVICTPNTEHSPFDLVVYKDGVFSRVQVKYKSMKNGRIEVTLRTTWADKTGTHTKYYDKSEIDIFCVYCPDTDECYYFDPKTVDKSITIRIKPPKINSASGVRLAENYREIPT